MQFDENEVIALLSKVKTSPSERLESETVEFKNYSNESALHNSKDLAEEISALANYKGGIIIIGVKDNSDVKHSKWDEQLNGFAKVDLDTVKERIGGKIKPHINLEFNCADFEGKNYLCINVPKRIDSIISTSSGKVCIRDGKSSRAASPDEIRDMVKSLQFYDWSAEDLDIAVEDGLNLVAVEDAKRDYCTRRGINFEDINNEAFLEIIGATKNGVLNKGGLLFLGNSSQIQKLLGNFEYRFSWKEKNGNLKINDVWSDCLWNSILRAKKHFKFCNNKIEITHIGSQYEFYQLDDVAFHEAFLNALVHRDYSHSGMVSINFTGKEIKISSPGRFYGGVTSENIVYHEPRHRNKILAHILMVFHLVDRAGVGVTRIGLSSLKYGRAFPTFIEKDDSIEVVMEAEYLRTGIFVITRSNLGFGITELVILNSVYNCGFILVSDLENILKKVTENPWLSIIKAMEDASLQHYVEFKGTNKGVYVSVKESYSDFFEVKRTLKTNTTSDKHIALFRYIKEFGSGSNQEITNLLGHSITPQTSRFLKRAEYVKKGKTANSKWTIR